MNSVFFEQLRSRPDLQYLLFRRGWVVSKHEVTHPFLSDWETKTVAGWHFLSHPDARCTIVESGGRVYFLMGHCYNPFMMQYSEDEILASIGECTPNTEEHQKRIDQLTGVFVLGWIDNEGISFMTDPSGMQSAYWGTCKNDNFILTSHPQLIADVYEFEMDPFVKELVAYKWYPRMKGCYLPADLSPYKELTRIVPDIQYHYDGMIVSHHRFWPKKDISFFKSEAEYAEGIKIAADILKNGMTLVEKKYSKPAISLTGGIDSNTTFAAANGLYDSFETFSYYSALKEKPDVEAAETIAHSFNTRHSTIFVPEDEAKVKDFDLKSKILRHNSGYIAERKANELRKRIYLEEVCSYDVEVKSWVSEAIRAYWYKHFNRESMPRMSAKLYRNLYKIFIGNRSLAHKIDAIFADYLKKYEYDKIPLHFDISDMNYLEMSMGSWGSLNISEMQTCFEITSIYNNRVFLETMLCVPLSDRIADRHHLDMKKYLNKELYDMNIRVVNTEETDRRARILNAIFTANMLLPF